MTLKCHLHAEVHYTGGSREEMQKWLGDDFTYVPQHEGDLGIRMFAAIRQHLGEHNSIILVGADCPAVDSTLLQDSLLALMDNDILLVFRDV